VYPFRVAYWIAGMVGALALVLTISGVYGVLSYIVAQRRRELGIRMALGADCRAVATLVLTHALRQAAVAVPIGALLALGAARVFAANVMMVDVFDGPSYAAGMLVVVGACVAASLAPAVRAMRIDPASTLRAE
jgi:ABC-type antimicrobial peptide transport system permease subunit